MKKDGEGVGRKLCQEIFKKNIYVCIILQLMRKYDEVANCGHITMKRKGRSVIFESNMEEYDIEKSKQKMKVNFPIIEKDMYDLLSEIEALIIDNLNPLDALGYITTKYLIVDPEKYAEYESNNSQLEVELIQNIILKNKHENYRKISDYESLSFPWEK